MASLTRLLTGLAENTPSSGKANGLPGTRAQGCGSVKPSAGGEMQAGREKEGFSPDQPLRGRSRPSRGFCSGGLRIQSPLALGRREHRDLQPLWVVRRDPGPGLGPGNEGTPAHLGTGPGDQACLAGPLPWQTELPLPLIRPPGRGSCPAPAPPTDQGGLWPTPMGGQLWASAWRRPPRPEESCAVCGAPTLLLGLLSFGLP